MPRVVLPRGTPGRWAAFTLVEVVIAVGLVAFVMTAILGLAMMAVNETKNADLKARLAWITERVTSEYQSQRFSTALVPTNGSVTSSWDFSGKPVEDDSPEAYFLCDVKNVTPLSASTNFALLQVSISWPKPTPTSTYVCVISLFNYE